MALRDMFGGGVVNEITGEADDDGSESFRKTLREGQTFGAASTASLTSGEFKKVGDGFVVPAQERYAWGQGAAQYAANQGYLYIDLRDDADAQMNATIRLQQRDAQERRIMTVYEEDTAVLTGSKSNREQKQAFPEQTSYPKVGRDSKLVVAADPASDGTASEANSEFLLPVTVYPV